MSPKQSPKKIPQVFKLLVAGTALLSLQACQTTATHIDALASDSNCQANALAMAEHASSSASSPQFLSAANKLQRCATELATGKQMNAENRMRLMAASTLNFIKGGDVTRAKEQIVRFNHDFAQQDLYFSDYTSFRDTASALLDSDSLTYEQFSQLNINQQLRNEIKRKQYWLSH
ncbi:MAG: hypothetical protein ACJA13_001088 [Paraglaciecola sp.]|jgi:hypothetical protein